MPVETRDIPTVQLPSDARTGRPYLDPHLDLRLAGSVPGGARGGPGSVPGAPGPVEPWPARTPVHRRPLGVGALLVGAAFCLGALVTTYVLAVWTPIGQALEYRNLNEGWGDPDGTWAWRLLDWFGEPLTLAVLVAAVLLVGLAARRFWAGVVGICMVGAAVLAARTLKEVLPRPVLDAADFATTHNSFPSGHVTVAAGLVLALVLALPARFRLLALVPGTVAVTVVLVATVVAQWHRPSDGIGGVLIAGAAYCLAAAGLHGYARR
ncbi:phosphatase PAP2 family protein [Longispora urticae]